MHEARGTRHGARGTRHEARCTRGGNIPSTCKALDRVRVCCNSPQKQICYDVGERLRTAQYPNALGRSCVSAWVRHASIWTPSSPSLPSECWEYQHCCTAVVSRADVDNSERVDLHTIRDDAIEARGRAVVCPLGGGRTPWLISSPKSNVVETEIEDEDGIVWCCIQDIRSSKIAVHLRRPSMRNAFDAHCDRRAKRWRSKSTRLLLAYLGKWSVLLLPLLLSMYLVD